MFGKLTRLVPQLEVRDRYQTGSQSPPRAATGSRQLIGSKKKRKTGPTKIPIKRFAGRAIKSGRFRGINSNGISGDFIGKRRRFLFQRT
jgi:hypothetical protein